VGVTRQAVDKWENINNATSSNTYIPDMRIVVDKKHYERIFNEIESGIQKGFIATVVPEPISSILFCHWWSGLSRQTVFEKKKNRLKHIIIVREYCKAVTPNSLPLIL